MNDLITIYLWFSSKTPVSLPVPISDCHFYPFGKGLSSEVFKRFFTFNLRSVQLKIGYRWQFISVCKFVSSVPLWNHVDESKSYFDFDVSVYLSGAPISKDQEMSFFKKDNEHIRRIFPFEPLTEWYWFFIKSFISCFVRVLMVLISLDLILWTL